MLIVTIKINLIRNSNISPLPKECLWQKGERFRSKFTITALITYFQNGSPCGGYAKGIPSEGGFFNLQQFFLR